MELPRGRQRSSDLPALHPPARLPIQSSLSVPPKPLLGSHPLAGYGQRRFSAPA